MEVEIENIPASEITDSLIKKKDILKDLVFGKNEIENTVFGKHKIEEKIMHPNICEWIILESEKHADKNGGWTNKRHKNYPTTDLPVRAINNIAVYLKNFTYYKIFPLLASHFNADINHLDINDLFIVKYKFDEQNHLEFHRDGNLISFNILLNDISEFEGGGTIIRSTNNGKQEDKLININKGDILIHSGKVMHSGNKITLGTRYIMVGFISYLSKY
jgi:hypothetical protein